MQPAPRTWLCFVSQLCLRPPLPPSFWGGGYWRIVIFRWSLVAVLFWRTGLSLVSWSMDVVVALAFTGTRSPRVHGHRPLEVCRGPWPRKGSRGMAMAVAASARLALLLRRTPDNVPWSLYSYSQRNGRPQPLGSRREAAPCGDTRPDL